MAKWSRASKFQFLVAESLGVGSSPGGDRCVLGKTHDYICLSTPRSKWVPARVEIVGLND